MNVTEYIMRTAYIRLPAYVALENGWMDKEKIDAIDTALWCKRFYQMSLRSLSRTGCKDIEKRATYDGIMYLAALKQAVEIVEGKND